MCEKPCSMLCRKSLNGKQHKRINEIESLHTKIWWQLYHRKSRLIFNIVVKSGCFFFLCIFLKADICNLSVQNIALFSIFLQNLHIHFDTISRGTECGRRYFLIYIFFLND